MSLSQFVKANLPLVEQVHTHMSTPSWIYHVLKRTEWKLQIHYRKSVVHQTLSFSKQLEYPPKPPPRVTLQNYQ